MTSAHRLPSTTLSSWLVGVLRSLGPGAGPNSRRRRRKPYARERGLVRSTKPSAEKTTKCKNARCSNVRCRKDLRFGYCDECWAQPATRQGQYPKAGVSNRGGDPTTASRPERPSQRAQLDTDHRRGGRAASMRYSPPFAAHSRSDLQRVPEPQERSPLQSAVPPDVQAAIDRFKK